MKRTTKKLSGVGLERFLRRFYGRYDDIDAGLAERLSEDGARTFTSVRVRSTAWRQWQRTKKAAAAAPKPQKAAEPPPEKSRKRERPVPAPVPAAALEQTAAAPKPKPKENGEAAFDPYAIGLVPVYQREGAEGLASKLAAIASLDNLRKMARSQQVALPADLRGSDADIDAVRDAIVAAVGKRIANRRAAAG